MELDVSFELSAVRLGRNCNYNTEGSERCVNLVRSETLRHGILFIALVFLVVCSCIALADGVYIPKVAADNDTADLSEPVQRAVIFHDGDQERLILQVSFSGNVSEFAWLVPTPSKPDIGEHKPDSPYSDTEELFKSIHLATAPRIKYWYDADDSLRLHARGGEDHPHASDVDVLERKVVGNYDVAVLQAKSAGDLLKWLRRHDYQVTPKLRPVLQDYIRRGWVFTAARINTVGYNKIREGMLEPLRLRFASQDLVYPLKVSSLNPGRTRVVLYVVANRFVSARGFRTVCAVNFKTPKRSGSISRVRECDRDDYYSYPSNEQPMQKSGAAKEKKQPTTYVLPPFNDYNYSITKLTAELDSSQMQRDVLLLPAKSLEQFEPQPVPPPLLANIGALIMLGVLRFFTSLIPYSLSLFCFVMGAVRAFNGHDARGWLFAALALLLGGIPLGMLLVFQDLGFGLVGLTAVVGIPVFVIRRLRRRRVKKTVAQ